MKTPKTSMKGRLVGMLCLFLISTITFAQNLTISGTVLDVHKEPVIGASVILEGSTGVGTITDFDGNFTLPNIPSNGKISISYIGYRTQEVPVNGRTSFSITLEEDSKQLDEVVVVGYGVQRKSDLTGSVSSVKAEDALKTMPTSNVTDALQGRMAGVSIVSSSGQPGSGSTIRVRGVNSISGDGGPLVVIDGFIGGELSALNPSDIESIEVLKDASATAVYGSRGANGVLLVTTKRAQKGTTRVTYSGYVNLKTPGKLPTQLSAADNARLQNSYMEEVYGIPPYTVGRYFTDSEIAAYERGEGGFDYLNGTFRNAIEQMHEISVSGSSDKTQYLVSASFNLDEGIVRNSEGTRANYRAKVDTEIRSWWKAGATLWGFYRKNSGPNFGQNLNVLNRALMFPRFLDMKDEEGKYNDLSREPNPMRKINEVESDGYTYNSYFQAYTDFNIMKGLTFRSSISFNLGNTNNQSANTAESYPAHPSQNGYTSATVSNSNSYGFLNTNVLSYINEFNEKHRINATAVFEQSYNTTFTSGITVRNLFDDNINFNNMGLAQTVDTPSSNRIKTTMMSFMGRVNYVLLNRYMITASYRYDGSSRLAKGNQWYGFPSVALAWDAQKEGFLYGVDWLSQAKLRLGYGVTGNQAVPAYSAYSMISQSVDNKGNISLSGTRRANPNLKWESTTQYNIGLDFGFMNNRFTASVDLYNKLSKDVILEVTLPATTGFTNELINAATIRNRGIEVTLGADVIDNRNFRWHTDVILSHNEGIIKRIDGIKQFMELSGNFENTAYRYIVGEKIGTMWGYINDGIWGTDDIANAPAGTNPGDYKYVDLDGDGQITPDKDRTVIGCGQPTFNWGWTNTFNFLNFDFSVFLTGFHGFDIYNNNDWLTVVDSRVSANPEWLNRWTPANQNTNIPSFQGKSSDKGISSRHVEKGNFIKVKTLTLGYNFKFPWMQQATIHNLRLFASAQNPFILTKYKGIDPEVTLKNTLTPGADWGYYPNGRNFIFGMTITF